MRAPAAVASLLTLAAVTACNPQPFRAAPAGAVAPVAEPAAPVTYENATKANGWSPTPSDSVGRAARDAEREARTRETLDAFRRLNARGQPVRVLVYFNGRLSPKISAWRRTSQNVIEVDLEEQGSAGQRSATQTIRIATETAEATEAGAQDLGTLLSHRVENLLVRRLLEGRAQVMDKALLVRKAAQGAAAKGYSEAEIRAVSRDVDLLLEVAFLASSSTPDGFEVVIRAIRTRDAALLAQASSTELEVYETSTSVKAVAGKGYETVTESHPVPLDRLADETLQLALRQVVERY